MPEFLLTERDGPLFTITLNRPEKRNALSLDLMLQLIDALKSVPQEAQVIILAGAGKAFSAGHDLSEMTGKDPGWYRRLFEVCSDLMLLLQAIPQTVIARVHGLATAAGCQLVASCDLAIASSAASFATPGVKIGLFCSTPMVPLTRAIGRKRAMEMLLTGRPIDAATAMDWGLVNRIVDPADLEDATRQWAIEIAQASGFTLGLGKQAFYAQIELDDAKAYAHTQEVMSLNAMAPDAQEGMTAFLQKRPARWQERSK